MARGIETFLRVAIQEAGIGAEGLRAIRREVSGLASAMRGVQPGQGATRFVTAMRDMKIATGAVSKANRELANDLVRTATAAEKARGAFYSQKTALDQAAKSARKFKNELHSVRATALDMSYLMGNLARTSGAILGGGLLAAFGFGRKTLNTRADFEQMETQLKVLTGRADAFKKVQAFALRSPLTFRDSVDAVNQLVNAGIDFKDIMRDSAGYLDVLTKAAVFARRPLEQVVRAVSMLKGGTYRSRDLLAIDITKDTFAKAGIGWESKQNRPEGLNAETGPRYLDLVMKALDEKFKNYDPAEQLKTKLANIGDAIDLFFNAIGKRFDNVSKPLLGRIQGFFLRLIDIVDSPAMTAAFNTLGVAIIDGFNKVADGVERLLSVIQKDPTLIPRFIAGLVEGFKNLAAIFVGATITQHLGQFAEVVATVFLAFKNGPFAILTIVAILGTFIATAILTKNKLNDLVPALGGTKKEGDDLAKAMDNVGTAFDNLAQVVTPLLKGALEDLWTAFSNLTGVDSPIQLLQIMVQGAADAINALAGAIAALNGYGFNSSGGVSKNQPTISEYLRTGKGRTDNIFSFEGMKNLGMSLGQQRRNEAAASKGKYAWPTNDPNARVGGFNGESHHGADIHGKAGDPIYAPTSGKIVKIGKNGIGDYRLWIEGEDGYKWYLTHFNEAFADGIKLGANVTAGQVLGTMAKYQHRARGGVVSDPHVHIGVVKSGWDADNSQIDPMSLLRGNTLPAFAADQSATIGLRSPGELAGLYAQAAQENAYRDFMGGGTPGAGYGMGKALGKSAGRLDDVLKAGVEAANRLYGWADGIDYTAGQTTKLGDVMRAAASKVNTWASGLRLQNSQAALGIQQALALQSGDERGAAYYGLRQQGNTINDLFNKIYKAKNDEEKYSYQADLASAISGLIGSRTDLKDKAPDIFNQWASFQDDSVKRYESIFGTLESAQAVVIDRFGSYVQQFGAVIGAIGARLGVSISNKTGWGGNTWAGPQGGVRFGGGGGYGRSFGGSGGMMGGGVAAGTTKRMPSGWSAPGWVNTSCNGDGTCNFEYVGEGGGEMPGYPGGGAFPEDEKKEKAPAQKVNAGLQTLAGVIGNVTALIQSNGENLASTIGGILDQYIPGAGGIFGAVGGLIDTLKGKKGRGIVVEKILDPVKTLPESATIFSAANPASLLFAGGMANIGAGFAKVVVELKGDADRIFTSKVASRAYNEALLEGM